MAHTLTEFPKHRGRPNIYNWDIWTNGEVWQLERGVDFTCDPRSFRTLVHRTKRARGIQAKTKINGDTITIQFISHE